MKTVKATIEVEFQLQPGRPEETAETAVARMRGAVYDALVKNRIRVMVASIKVGSKHEIVAG
jgi:hypothetical protein